MTNARRFLQPIAWTVYGILVFEILFMISPFALHFYAAYGPALNFLHRWPATAWLTQFFLPHFSQTRSPVLNALHELAWLLIAAGIAIFLAAAIPLYRAKLRGRGPVTGGLYACMRHPQYAGLAVLGLGTLLLWPRFLVLLSYVTMLSLYGLLARWEEARCLARFGEGYRAYQARTGRFLPHRLSGKLPRLLPAPGAPRVLTAAALAGVGIAVAGMLGFGLRDFSLSRIAALYTEEAALLSPALLTDQELRAAYRTATGDPRVQTRLHAARPGQGIVYVIPTAWYLPDLPLEMGHRFRGHHTPGDFERHRLKLLFTRARTHAPEATGRGIVKAAYGRDPLLLVEVDLVAKRVTAIATPPPHVRWGDIPTPLF